MNDFNDLMAGITDMMAGNKLPELRTEKGQIPINQARYSRFIAQVYAKTQMCFSGLTTEREIIDMTEKLILSDELLKQFCPKGLNENIIMLYNALIWTGMLKCFKQKKDLSLSMWVCEDSPIKADGAMGPLSNAFTVVGVEGIPTEKFERDINGARVSYRRLAAHVTTYQVIL